MTYTAAGYKAAKKYKADKVKRIPLDVQMTDYERIKAAAAAAGESVNGFIKKAVFERIEKEAKP